MRSPLPTSWAAERVPFGVLFAFLLSLPAPAQTTKDGDPVPPPGPAFVPDLKLETWAPGPKAGTLPSDNSHLPLAERRAIDAAWNAIAAGRKPSATAADDASGARLAASQLRSGVDPLRFHQTDVDADGRLWVHGGTYKASFGPEGATYIPFLGSTAPQNFPIRFELASASVGALPLEIDAAPVARFEGSSAILDRGALTERYETSVGEVEQLFVFEGLPTRGEITLRIGVETELVGETRPDGLAWVNDFGGVTYSNAIAIDAAGRRVSATTTLEGGAITIRVPADFVEFAQLPLTIDPLVYTFFPNTSASADVGADIAWDDSTSRFIIVWERAFSVTDHDIWSEMFTLAGTPISGTAQYIDFTGSDWLDPKVANNAYSSQFLVVAVRASGQTTEIWGREREAESLVQSPQFQISSSFGNKRFADVGGDPYPSIASYYCVVWEREASVGVDHDIHAQLVTTTGALQGGLILVDNSSASYDKFPCVAKSAGLAPANHQEWSIVWNRQYSPQDWDVRGAQIHWNGVVTETSFSVDFSFAHDLLPKVSTTLAPNGGPRTYLTTYQRLDAGNWDIQATSLRGREVLARQNLSDLWVVGAGQNEEYPVCDSNGSHFAVAYARAFNAAGDYDVYVAGIHPEGTGLGLSEGPVNLAFSSTFEGYPEMGSRYGSGTPSDYFGVVWSEASGNGDIEGAIYELPDYYGEVGTNYCASPANSTGSSGNVTASGTSIRAQNALFLQARQVPTFSTLIFVTSQVQGFVPNAGGSAGTLCLGGSIGRFNAPGQVLNTGSSGVSTLLVNLQFMPAGSVSLSATAGQTWNFQAWHRDLGNSSNFTNATSVVLR